MRGILFTTLALLALGWLASTVEFPQVRSHSGVSPTAAIQDDSERVIWRRTAQGWEKRTTWLLTDADADSDTQHVRQPLIVHPMAIAVVQGFAIFLALATGK